MKHNHRIKISSEEQFVPIYLSLFLDDQLEDAADREYEHYGLSVRVNNSTFASQPLLRMEEGASTLTRLKSTFYSGSLSSPSEFARRYKDLIGARLMEILTAPPPKEYTFFINDESTYNYSTSDIIALFSGSYLAWNSEPLRTPNGAFIGFGIYGRFNPRRTYDTINGKFYDGESWGVRSMNDYVPHILVVIKAKQLKRVRASMVLGKPLQMEHGDIKLLINSNGQGGVTGAAIQEATLSTLRRQEGVSVEYLEGAEIAKYLYNQPARLTASQALERARIAVKQPYTTKILV